MVLCPTTETFAAILRMNPPVMDIQQFQKYTTDNSSVNTTFFIDDQYGLKNCMFAAL